MIRHPYTKSFKERALVLSTICQVSDAFDPRFDVVHPVFTAPLEAVWDTGSQVTVISIRIVEELGLYPMGQVMMRHAKGTTLANTYKVNLILPNGMEVPNLFVMDGEMGETDVLLGMDVISLGDLCITQPNNKTQLTYQTPSSHCTDYTKE